MNDQSLNELTVREFIHAVASPEQPVPAGGSVAAFTGAASAALLALVCGVLQRHEHRDSVAEALRAAERLQAELLELVDADAAAFRAFLDANRTGADTAEALSRLNEPLLHAARKCLETIELSREVEAQTSGPVVADVHAARYLAIAALESAIGILRQNLPLITSARERQALQRKITRLASRQAR